MEASHFCLNLIELCLCVFQGVRNSAADQRPLNCSVTTDCSISSSKQVGNENSVSCKLVASSSLDRDDRSSTTEGVICLSISSECHVSHYVIHIMLITRL